MENNEFISEISDIKIINQIKDNNYVAVEFDDNSKAIIKKIAYKDYRFVHIDEVGTYSNLFTAESIEQLIMLNNDVIKVIVFKSLRNLKKYLL